MIVRACLGILKDPSGCSAGQFRSPPERGMTALPRTTELPCIIYQEGDVCPSTNKAGYLLSQRNQRLRENGFPICERTGAVAPVGTRRLSVTRADVLHHARFNSDACRPEWSITAGSTRRCVSIQQVLATGHRNTTVSSVIRVSV